VLFTDAVRVNRGRLRHESALPTRLLGVGLPLTIVTDTLAGLALFPLLDLWAAATLATMPAPTDAVPGLPGSPTRGSPTASDKAQRRERPQ
jgi:sodium/hydrogen antiporter